MARWRGQEPAPEVPGWIRHEADGGFVLADWVEAGDFQLEPAAAESRARGRWIAARCAWLNEHPDVGTILLEQLQERVRRIP
jgi:hypothetical protein